MFALENNGHEAMAKGRPPAESWLAGTSLDVTVTIG
jgi:hypothetical protein